MVLQVIPFGHWLLMLGSQGAVQKPLDALVKAQMPEEQSPRSWQLPPTVTVPVVVVVVVVPVFPVFPVFPLPVLPVFPVFPFPVFPLLPFPLLPFPLLPFPLLPFPLLPFPLLLGGDRSGATPASTATGGVMSTTGGGEPM